MDEIKQLRSFIDAVDLMANDWPPEQLTTQDAVVGDAEDAEPLDVLAELEMIKFKLINYESSLSIEAAEGFDNAVMVATNLIDSLISKVRNNV